MGLRSGLFPGHTPFPHILQGLLVKVAIVAFAAWLGVPSCWKVIFFLLGNNEQESNAWNKQAILIPYNIFRWSFGVRGQHATHSLLDCKTLQQSSLWAHFLVSSMVERHFSFPFCMGVPVRTTQSSFYRRKKFQHAFLERVFQSPNILVLGPLYQIFCGQQYFFHIITAESVFGMLYAPTYFVSRTFVQFLGWFSCPSFNTSLRSLGVLHIFEQNFRFSDTYVILWIFLLKVTTVPTF